MTADDALQRLETFDPELAQTLAEACRQSGSALTETDFGDMVDTILLGYHLDMNLGAAVADGFHRLLVGGPHHAVTAFGLEIREAAQRSVGLARNLAALLPIVLLTPEAGLGESFHQTLGVLLAKGEYLVKAPLEGLAPLTAPPDGSATAYLELLQAVFHRTLSYNRCQYLGNLLPRAIGQLEAPARRAQIRQLIRLIRTDLDLIEPYLEGLSGDLALLSPKALAAFVDQALDLQRDAPQTVRRFLALRSSKGRSTCQSLQTAVRLKDVLPRLNRYLQARIGQTGRIRPLSAIGKTENHRENDRLRSGTDGVYLYLPDVVDALGTHEDNLRLLTTLAKFEAGLMEFGSFTFDLERARDMGCLADGLVTQTASTNAQDSDFTRFSRGFDNPRLAMDLLTVFEHARIRVRQSRTYPGLLRGGLPLYQAAMRSALESGTRNNFLNTCYAVLALDLPPAPLVSQDPASEALLLDIVDAFAACDPETMRVEHAAGLAATFYGRVQETLTRQACRPVAFTPAYRMPLQAGLIDAAGRDVHDEAGRLAARLHACGLKLYRGDLRRLLQQGAGRPTAADILRLVCPTSSDPADSRDDDAQAPAPQLPADILAAGRVAEALQDPEDVDRITWLKEWNSAIGDYLHDHVRVRDRRLSGTDPAFYTEVLNRCDPLVRRIRRTFELLRPEGVGILRQWVEGDDFDYRALLDFVLDRRAGRQPSERLYIKRVKQRRDVAVMLLVDLSRSTSNIVSEGSRSVLEVAKETIVLFTQALEVVGDRYAVAGFSGTGRLGVDFFRIKDFDKPLNASVKGTISALTPQRSTRMGAAVRRATLDLMALDNRVRLLLLIGDGFPNDTEYKDHYAIQDTRQAIGEACSRGIITQAITVNLPTSPRLDELYGRVRHTVISNVQELPDKLLRIYGMLTRV